MPPASPPAIKWPNDVLIGGRKVAGILPEAVSGPGTGVRHVLLGIGVNVDQPAFPEDLAATATSLRLATGRPVEPRALLAPILDHLSARYAEWCGAGLAGLLDAWRRRSVTLGTTVHAAGAGRGGRRRCRARRRAPGAARRRDPDAAPDARGRRARLSGGGRRCSS